MVLGFQKHFHPHVRDGSKRHSIRAGRRWREGMVADCYGKVRQKGQADSLLGRWPVVKVESIRVLNAEADGELTVIVDGVELNADEKNLLAWRDGFRNSEPAAGASMETFRSAFDQFTAFWLKTHGKFGWVNFRGQIIHWDYDRPLYRNAKGKAGAARP